MNLNKIDYIEFATLNIDASKRFFETVFGWGFVDYGPEYTAFSDQGLDGGFYLSEQVANSEHGAPLTVFYTDQLESFEQKVTAAGGIVTKPIFDFPGGRRFQFREPGGNELAIWSE